MAIQRILLTAIALIISNPIETMFSVFFFSQPVVIKLSESLHKDLHNFYDLRYNLNLFYQYQSYYQALFHQDSKYATKLKCEKKPKPFFKFLFLFNSLKRPQKVPKFKSLVGSLSRANSKENLNKFEHGD